MPRRPLAAPLLFLCFAGTAAAAPADDAAFDKAVDGYYAELLAFHPTHATDLGIHSHDGELESYAAARVAAEVAALAKWKAAFAALDGAKLGGGRADDLAIVRSGVEARLFDLTEVETHRHRADLYPEKASESIDVLIKRDFAPAAERLRAAIAREEKIPALLAEARDNLADVPPVSVDVAEDELAGIAAFFQGDVPAAFAQVKDKQLRARFRAANAAVLAALEKYRAFLAELRPRAHGSFALGAERYRKKLLLEEMIDTPVDELERRGEAELRRLQAEFRATAAKIDPKKSPAEVQAEIAGDHPKGDRLLAETRERLAGLRRFLVEHDIVSVPSEVMPRVAETPPFMRATTFASMSTPGPFEPRATEAYYNVTLPDPKWPADRVEAFLRGAGARPLLDVVTIHEAFPGHYVQFLWVNRLRSKVRKYEDAGSNSEGWAHYCEQMILDEGFHAGDPKLRLMQLQDALLRAARYLAGIRMHTRGMTLEQAIDLFEKEGYQTHPVAVMEARRGTRDATYLVYTLGKLEILRLRDDYRKKLGAGFTLKKFHDAFLAQGPAPLPLVRKALLDGK